MSRQPRNHQRPHRTAVTQDAPSPTTNADALGQAMLDRFDVLMDRMENAARLLAEATAHLLEMRSPPQTEEDTMSGSVLQAGIDRLIADVQAAPDPRAKMQAIFDGIAALMNGALARAHASGGGPTPAQTQEVSDAVHALATNAHAFAQAAHGDGGDGGEAQQQEEDPAEQQDTGEPGATTVTGGTAGQTVA